MSLGSLDGAGEIFLFAMGVLVLLFSFFSCIVLIHSLLRDHIKRATKHKARNNPNSASNKVVYLSSAAAIFYLLSAIAFLGTTTRFDVAREHNLTDDDLLVVLVLFFVFFLMMARLSIYCQFLIRLNVVFLGTAFELSRRTIVGAIALLSSLFVAVLWWITVIVIHFLFDITLRFYDSQFIALMLCLFVLEAATSVLIVGLFTDKLFRIIVEFKPREEIERAAAVVKAQNSENQLRPQTVHFVAPQHSVDLTADSFADSIARDLDPDGFSKDKKTEIP